MSVARVRRTRPKRLFPCLTAALAALLSSSAGVRAHHGAAAYVTAGPVSLPATVTRVDWANPHALITFTTTATANGLEEWTAETAGPVMLVRAGWSRTTLKPGDHITIVGLPARNGSRTMLLQRVVFGDGRELTSFVPR